LQVELFGVGDLVHGHERILEDEKDKGHGLNEQDRARC
jgi:hypothetical protein